MYQRLRLLFYQLSMILQVHAWFFPFCSKLLKSARWKVMKRIVSFDNPVLALLEDKIKLNIDGWWLEMCLNQILIIYLHFHFEVAPLWLRSRQLTEQVNIASGSLLHDTLSISLMTMTTLALHLQSCNWKIHMFYHNMIEGLIEEVKEIFSVVKSSSVPFLLKNRNTIPEIVYLIF